MLRKLAILLIPVLALLAGGCSDDDCPSCPKVDAILLVSVHSIDFGVDGAQATFQISNKGEKTLSWTVTTPGTNWLNLSATSGNDDAVITVTLNRDLINPVGETVGTIRIDAPDAINEEFVEIDVIAFNGSQWLSNDDGDFDTCADVDDRDYYWVKRFDVSGEGRGVLVDSISFYFCDADTIILLLAYGAVPFQQTHAPDVLPSYVADENVQVVSGWNTIPVDWYFVDQHFFLGYFQPGASVPRLGIDTGALDSLDSWWARDLSAGATGDSLVWIGLDLSGYSFGIRAFITPIITPSAKLAGFYNDDLFSPSRVDLLLGKDKVIRRVNTLSLK